MRQRSADTGADGVPWPGVVTGRRARHVLAGAAATLLILVVIGGVWDRGAAAQGRGPAAGPPLTAQEVIDALRLAGLSVDNLRQQPVGGSPSGPPATEREAWAFSIPTVAPSGARILVFADDERLNKKAAWFRRAEATVIVVRNVIVWLDPGIDGPVAAGYRRALQGMR